MKKVIMPFGLFMQDLWILQKPEITVRNKRGKKVRVLCTDANIPGFPVVGIVEVNEDNPNGNYAETYTKEGHYSTGDSENDLVVEVDNDAIIRRFGVDPLAAASIASALFGDPRQYSKEELSVISRLVLATTAFAAM